jgi:hypothetical protein
MVAMCWRAAERALAQSDTCLGKALATKEPPGLWGLDSASQKGDHCPVEMPHGPRRRLGSMVRKCQDGNLQGLHVRSVVSATEIASMQLRGAASDHDGAAGPAAITKIDALATPSLTKNGRAR